MYAVFGCEIIVLDDKEDVSDAEELTRDLMALLASFSGKYYGRRSLERRKKKMIEIINNLLLCLELEGDGGCTSFTAKEKDDMYNYLISLKTQEENKTKHSIKCYNCKQIVDYTDNDVKDTPFVICPECKTEICILD